MKFYISEIPEIPQSIFCIFKCVPPLFSPPVSCRPRREAEIMGYRVRSSVFTLRFLLVAFSVLVFTVSAEQLSLVVGESSTLQISPRLLVKNSPGLKPGTAVLCERVHIQGISRLKHLDKYAHSAKVKVTQNSSIIRQPLLEACFHRNRSLGIGMCPQWRWEKVSQDSWARAMSPFDHKILDVRVIGLSSETLEVSIEEEFFIYRLIFLILGTVLLSLASALSKSLVFYYSSAMAVGIILVVLIVLFQGMKLLPTGRKSSLAIVLYSSLLGFGSFLLGYFPRLLRLILREMGISEDMYNPLAIFLLAFLFLAGAWLGFWVVRKLVLMEDGSVDTSTSSFVAWSIRILAGVMVLQSSLDPLLAGGAFISAVVVSLILKKTFRLKFLRRIFKRLFKLVKKGFKGVQAHAPELSPVDDLDEFLYERPEASKFLRHRYKHLTLNSCSSPKQGITRTPPGQLSSPGFFPSTFHQTPERRNFSKDEWERFTRDSTEKAVEELVSSPDFGKWVAKNAERISVTPITSRQRKRWRFLWFGSAS